MLLGLTVAWAQDEAELLDRLKHAPELEAMQIEQELVLLWSRSGSASADLLLERGREAMAVGDLTTAIEHLTALVDHAPEFAEGWNARATAYYHAGLYGPSMADIARTLALNPNHFGAMTGMAWILEETARPEDALKVLRRNMAIHPNRPGLREAVERLEQMTGGKDI